MKNLFQNCLNSMKYFSWRGSKAWETVGCHQSSLCFSTPLLREGMWKMINSCAFMLKIEKVSLAPCFVLYNSLELQCEFYDEELLFESKEKESFSALKDMKISSFCFHCAIFHFVRLPSNWNYKILFSTYYIVRRKLVVLRFGFRSFSIRKSLDFLQNSCF